MGRFNDWSETTMVAALVWLRPRVVLSALALLAPALPASADSAPGAAMTDAARPPPVGREVLPGPVRATVLKVVDGDTLTVRARIWVGQDLEINVRIFGIDTPELRGRCDAEKALARQARDLVKARVASGSVWLSEIRYDKYGGRVVARVEADGGDLGRQLVAAGLARAYDGGKRTGWCG